LVASHVKFVASEDNVPFARANGIAPFVNVALWTVSVPVRSGNVSVLFVCGFQESVPVAVPLKVSVFAPGVPDPIRQELAIVPRSVPPGGRKMT